MNDRGQDCNSQQALYLKIVFNFFLVVGMNNLNDQKPWILSLWNIHIYGEKHDKKKHSQEIVTIIPGTQY